MGVHQASCTFVSCSSAPTSCCARQYAPFADINIDTVKNTVTNTNTHANTNTNTNANTNTKIYDGAAGELHFCFMFLCTNL